jgi:hypothetical protein
MAVDPNVLMSEIDKASAKYGLNRDDLVRMAQIESSFGKNLGNPNSSAKGPFQFIDSTWGQYGRGQNVMDTGANTDAAARLMLDNKNALTRKLGREPSGWELYLAHQQGIGGAQKLLLSPEARASDLVGHKAVALNGGNSNMSGQDFASIWKAKYEGSKVPQMVGVQPGAAQSAAPEYAAQRPQAPALIDLSQFAQAPAQPQSWQSMMPEPQKAEAPSTTDFLAKLNEGKAGLRAAHAAAVEKALAMAYQPNYDA